MAFTAVGGFILDSNNNGGTVAGANGQCVTLMEFHSTIKQLQRENDDLRHEMGQYRIESDKALAVLTSQLQIKFKKLEKTLTTANDTAEMYESTENKYSELAKNHTNLQTEFSGLKKDYVLLENELSQTNSKMVSLESKVDTFKDIKAVQQLQDLTSLKQKIQTIETKTHSLEVNEQARGQDVLALYNQTVDIKVNGKNRFLQMEQNISDIRETGIINFFLYVRS